MKWQYTKGLHDLGNHCYAWLQPDGGWGLSNAGLIVDGDQTLLVDTLFDLAHTREMLAAYRIVAPHPLQIISACSSTRTPTAITPSAISW